MKCLTVFAVIVAIFGAIVGYGYLVFTDLTRPLPKPDYKDDTYWGRGDGKNYAPDEKIYDFVLDVPQAEIDDLRQQLNRTLKLAEPLDGIAFEYGFNAYALQQFVDYWRDKYLTKWDERQAYFNELKQYKTEIQGLNIHFIHERVEEEVAEKKQVVPLLLLHGWPGSVREFYDFIPMLRKETNISDYAFEVVAPSLVGFGWSDAATRPGFNAAEMATVMRNLMLRLGHKKFLVQGGDWGSIIGSNLATLYPDNVLGYHSNMCILSTPLSILKSIYINYYPEKVLITRMFYDHHVGIWDKYKQLIEESGYYHIQATKPDTIGAALDSSPVALAGYILEKFQTCTGPALNQDFGAMVTVYGLEAVLDNLMVYYLNSAATTAGRFYAENSAKAYRDLQLDRVQTPVPMGCARFRNDLPPASDWQLRDKFPNLKHSMYFQHGGHFAAMEMPSMLYNDFTTFVQKIGLNDE
ncbi:juvenile hormone epoxide hydrolase 1 [Drosophila nasuta]|uniref:Epoxide hydrolase n=3 Tax=nasuta subgroup TaxID=32307 RepID=A0A6P8WX33_DROAB|nr:juvenile hormone epoxide hydrolase 1 [Drosophila albomicans]XP_060655459.1 juvenile hormone epoxide hydrolase 1 [Drosophila nasuta]